MIICEKNSCLLIENLSEYLYSTEHCRMYGQDCTQEIITSKYFLFSETCNRVIN